MLWQVLRRRRSNSRKCSIWSPLDAPHLPNCLTLYRTINVRVLLLTVLIDCRRGNAIEIDLKQEKGARVVLVVTICYLEQELFTIGAMHKPLVPKRLRPVFREQTVLMPNGLRSEVKCHASR